MENKFLGLRTAIYMVDDMEKAKEWYSDIFQTQPYFDEPFYIGFNIGGYELGLHPPKETGKKVDSVTAYWGVENIGTTMEWCKSKGAEEYEKITDVGGGIKVGSIKDPWGNVVGIIENPLFKLE